MIRLRILGGASIDDEGRPVARLTEQRKALALLAVIAVSGDRRVSRDRLLALFWPESSQSRARNALNQTLHAVRRALANDDVILGGAELRLNPSVISADVCEFVQALDVGDLERAISLYRGPFLDALHLRDAGEFERWLETERASLADRFARAVEHLARTEMDRGMYAAALSGFRRLVATNPLSSRYTIALMEALVQAGDPAGALHAAQVHIDALRTEFDAPPDKAIVAMVARVRREAAEREAPHQFAPTAAESHNPLSLTDPRAPAASSLNKEIAAALVSTTMPPDASARSHQRVSRFAPIIGGALGLGLVIALAATLAPGGNRKSRAAGGVTPLRLAVLPFDNLGDSADAYFADGMTEAIRDKLTGLSGFDVIASQSSNRFRHATGAPEDIARELGARYLVIGTVRWLKTAGKPSRVRVSPEVIDAVGGTARWAEPFDEPLTDVFRVQTDIATQVAEHLRVTLTPTTRRALDQMPTRSLDAYDAYLRGQHLLDDASSPLVNHRAAEAFREAVQLDSMFALAWAGLSEAYVRLALSSWSPAPAIEDSAGEAAARVRALAPEAPQAYFAQGRYEWFVRWRASDAIATLKAGLQLSPNNVALLHTLAEIEVFAGRWAAGVTHDERALDLDPLNSGPMATLGEDYLWLRRYDRARHLLDRARVVDPTYLRVYELRAMVELAQGDLAAARAVIRSAPPGIDSVSLMATLVGDHELAWMLDSAYARVLFQSRPSAFRDGIANWGYELALAYALRGDSVRMRAYADSGLAANLAQAQAKPTAPGPFTQAALLLTMLGRREDGIAEGLRGLAVRRVAIDAMVGPVQQHVMAVVYIQAGQQNRALDLLERVLSQPYYLSPAWLRIDPTFAPLHGSPRFQRLIAAPPTVGLPDSLSTGVMREAAVDSAAY